MMNSIQNTALISLGGLLMCTCSYASAFPVLMESEGSLTITENTVDDTYAAGESVRISSDIDGDAVVAGGEVSITSSVSGDGIVAGGIIDISGNIADDLRAAGGDIEVSGNIGDDAFIAGAVVRIKESNIGGAVFIAAADVYIENTTIAEGGSITGENIFIDAQVEGDLSLYGDRIEMGPNFSVTGDLQYAGSVKNKALEEIQSVVTGGVTESSVMKHISKGASKGVLAGYISLVVSLVLFGMLLLIALPKFFTKVGKNTVSGIWSSLGLGWLWFIVTPIVAVLISITVIGLPVGLFLLGMWGLLFIVLPYLCTAALAAFIINWKGLTGFAWSFAAVVLAALIIAIPFTMVVIAPFIVGGMIKEKGEILAGYRK